jgi:hypothetical protein
MLAYGPPATLPARFLDTFVGADAGAPAYLAQTHAPFAVTHVPYI